MYKKESQRLDAIIDTAIGSIETSNGEIKEISLFAKKEYQELEDEFLRLRIEATDIIKRVEMLEREYKKSRTYLSAVNKNYSKYSEKEMKAIYEQTDSLRVELAVEQERESNLIKRRNELEVHLKSLRRIVDKADKLSSKFSIAASLLSGNLREINEKLGDIKNKELLGLKIIQAQEAERQRIARDVHDGPAQGLSNLVLKAEFCIKLLDKDIDRAKYELQVLKALIRETINDTRRLIYNLRPMSIDDLGLIPTLERYVDTIENANDFAIELIVHNDTSRGQTEIAEEITLTCFRIVQEAMNNIIKYARANKIEIQLDLTEDCLQLIITDDGIGFDVSKIRLNEEDNTGFGLSMMKERVGLLLGELDISSGVKGTTVSARIPMKSTNNKK